MPEEIEITPVGYTHKVKLKVLPEDRRPIGCPDPEGCKMIHVSPMFTKEDQRQGYSGSCYGYCGRQEFQYKNVHHVNDISHCVFTPLKGVVRFFNNLNDFTNDIYDIKQIIHILKYPRVCEECKDDGHDSKIIGIIKDSSLPHDKVNDDNNRIYLCVACAVRLGKIHFHPEAKGAAGHAYY